jgi:DNA-binding MarR family transcriptional regulator
MSRVPDDETFGRRVASKLGACTCANIRRASRVVTQIYDAALQPAGLKITQFILLATLAATGATALTKLAEAMVMDRTTLTRNLKPLLKEGLIDSVPGEDRRSRVISLTKRGRAALMTGLPLWREAQANMVGALGQERLNGFLNDLSAVVQIGREG